MPEKDSITLAFSASGTKSPITAGLMRMIGLDLAGKKFSGWTVTEIDKSKGPGTFWKCVCVCGNRNSIHAPRLIRGCATRCRSCSARDRSDTHVNLSGMVFGLWAVVSQTFDDDGSLKWACKCECGNKGKVRTIDLERGSSSRCKTCAVKLLTADLHGKTFGRWTVLEQVHGAGRGGHWRCRCECGAVKVKWASELVNSQSRECRKCSNLRPRIRPYESVYNKLVRSFASRSQTRNSDLTYEQFIHIISDARCHYCHKSLQFTRNMSHGKKYSGYQLDRKDNSSGYTQANLVTCCKHCNMARGNHYDYETWHAMTAVLRAKNDAANQPEKPESSSLTYADLVSAARSVDPHYRPDLTLAEWQAAPAVGSLSSYIAEGMKAQLAHMRSAERTSESN